MSAAEVFQSISAKAAGKTEQLSKLNASYQFNLTGEGGGTFHAVFLGSVDIGEGPAANPGCTITMSTSDFKDLVAGKLNPTMAFMSGKIKISGDMGMAMKLQTVLA